MFSVVQYIFPWSLHGCIVQDKTKCDRFVFSLMHQVPLHLYNWRCQFIWHNCKWNHQDIFYSQLRTESMRWFNVFSAACPYWYCCVISMSCIYWCVIFNLCTECIALSSCHLTTTSFSFIRWFTKIMSLDWNCHGWLNSETLRSVSMVTWYSPARMWKPWSRSPSTRRLPTWHCPGGTQRRRAPYLLTSAPQSPAACCCSAMAICWGYSLTGSPGQTSSP